MKMSNIEAMIEWMTDRLGKVTYSMNARLGPNSYDCSSAVYFALIAGGFLPAGAMGNTDTLFGHLERAGWKQVQPDASGNHPVKRGDVGIWGERGASGGAAGHTMIFLDDKDTMIHCNYGYNGITINNHDTIWNLNGRPPVAIYRYTGDSGTTKPSTPKPQPTPKPVVKNDVDYMRQYGQVQWNGRQFNVDDRSQYAGIWQVVSNELGGLTPTPTTSDTEWINNGVPMSVISWTDGTPQSSVSGNRFKFDQDLMNIVDYDVPSNGIAVLLAGHKVWIDATVARKA